MGRIIGRENIFFSTAGILASTRDALLFAETLVGTGAAEVRIFHDRPEEEFGAEAEPVPLPGAICTPDSAGGAELSEGDRGGAADQQTAPKR